MTKGRTSNRVYYYHESVTSLTLLGKMLLDAGQLSYGESSTDVGRRTWSGPQQRLIGRFLFQTDDPADTVSIGGDDIALPWAKE